MLPDLTKVELGYQGFLKSVAESDLSNPDKVNKSGWKLPKVRETSGCLRFSTIHNCLGPWGITD